MTALYGLGAIIGRGNWELAARKTTRMRSKSAHQPTGQKFGLEMFKRSDCNPMAAFGFGDPSLAILTAKTFSFQRAFRQIQTGRIFVLVTIRYLPSSQMERFGVGEETQISTRKQMIQI